MVILVPRTAQLFTLIDGFGAEVRTGCPHCINQMRELLASVRGQRRTVSGAPQDHTAAGADVGADRADQRAQIAQSLVDGQVLQIVEAGRRRRQIRTEVPVIGGGQYGAHFGGDVHHQTALDPFVSVDTAVADVNEDGSVRAVVQQVLRVGLAPNSSVTQWL